MTSSLFDFVFGPFVKIIEIFSKFSYWLFVKKFWIDPWRFHWCCWKFRNIQRGGCFEGAIAARLWNTVTGSGHIFMYGQIQTTRIHYCRWKWTTRFGNTGRCDTCGVFYWTSLAQKRRHGWRGDDHWRFLAIGNWVTLGENNSRWQWRHFFMRHRSPVMGPTALNFTVAGQ